MKDAYGRLPKEVRTMVRAGDLPRTERGIDRLVRKYNLTPKQKTTLVRLRDLASKNLNQVLRALGVVDRRRARPRVDPQTGQAVSTLQGMDNRLRELNGKRTRPKVDADTGPAAKKTDDIRDGLNRVGGMRPSPTISINDRASGPLRSVQGLLNSIDGRHTSSTHTHTTINRTINRRGNAEGGLYERGAQVFADGGLTRLWSARDAAYAAGGLRDPRDPRDVRDGHAPELARSGDVRIWREPETGGEAYIPLRNDYRRPRAEAILEETAALMGGSVSWNAQGGVYRPSGMDGARAFVGGGTVNFPRELLLRGRLQTDAGWADIEAVAEVAAERVVGNAFARRGRRAYADSITWAHDDEEG